MATAVVEVRTALLIREETGAQGTFGRIFCDGLTLFTGELPWRQNAPNVSCIPAGRYRCAFTYSPAFKRMMFIVRAVPRRSGIRIHPANLMGDRALGYRSQLYGCLALGERLGSLDGQKAVLLSATAVRRFEAAMNQQPFDLEIVDA